LVCYSESTKINLLSNSLLWRVVMPSGKEHDKELDALIKMGDKLPSAPGADKFQDQRDKFLHALKGASCEDLKALDTALGPVELSLDTAQAAKTAIATVRDHKQCTRKGR
jgi:hypothetical protein